MGKFFDTNSANYHELNSCQFAEFVFAKSVFVRVHPWLIFFFRPARCEFVQHAEMVENAGNDCVGEFGD